ncbi:MULTISPECIES: hypothetical protein [unclassified Streptomyces]|uniref:hypothetical protein n=1 Tax=unclassified Streptomyces TaxID=2593676 RepID=UPI000DAC106F|nr:MULTISPECIES: hypothetical protein [unclassified Streptomyces]PZT72562.1 hypothetical protein DNK55_29045 [Streptomyces sp. AC1-42T]PZT81120.1 hypothetical protein DNK56_02525 [Streptomyces sp. AC1-42W]
MATNDWQRMADEKVAEAERARDELREALGEAGLKLPSLGIDAISCAGPNPSALIDLGRCNVVTARALAVALRSGGAV